MSIEHSLAELLTGLDQDHLPPLCNVVVQFASAPLRSAGNRWEIPLIVPESARKAVLAIHDNPLPGGLRLNYPATAEQLLELFSDERLRSLLAPGESALVQAEPRYSVSQQRLFLNIEAILLVRPWRTFGRRQIDFAAGCSRKHYLSVVKGVRAAATPQLLPTWQSLAGLVAHDLIEAAASDLPAALRRDEAFLRKALSPATSIRLVAAGAVNLSISVTAMQRGLRALEVLARSPALTDLLRVGGPWLTETDTLDRGVALTPDLVGDRTVIELKRQSPESAAARAETIATQARGYLAWAMVTHGIDQVVSNWRAALVNVHERVAETDRVVTLTADRVEIARRVRNRHRLVALSDGSWLPSPIDSECSHCEFHRISFDLPGLPPACQFHCQTERSWPCADLDTDSTCPLYGTCNEHSRYHDFRMLDLFNRLREDLAAEDEEGELAAAEVARDVARHWGPFHVRVVSTGEIRLTPQDHLALIDGAVPGQVFDVRADDTVLVRARFRRLRDGDWQLLLEDGAGRVNVNQLVSLTAVSVGVYPARDQLTQLELAQRTGRPPGALRYGDQGRQTPRVLYCQLDNVPIEMDTVIVDAITGRQQVEALRQLVPPAPSRTLILPGTDWDAGQLPSGTLIFDELSAYQWLTEGDGTSLERVKAAAEDLAQAHRIALPWNVLNSTALGGWASGFDTIIVTDAHALPALTLARALEMRPRRFVLIGSAIAAGPATEAIGSSRSPLFANLIRQTIDTEGALLPASVKELAIVRFPVRIAVGLTPIVDNVESSIPTGFHVTEGSTEPKTKPIEMRGSAPLAIGQAQAVRVRAHLPPGTQLSYRAARSLLRNLAPSAFEALLQRGLPRSGDIDHSLINQRIVVEAATSSFLGQHNELVLSISQDLAPLSLREGLANFQEAVAVVSHAKAHTTLRFVATSPFTAQCRAIAAAAHSEGLENLRVLVPERVTWKPQADRLDLLLSLAVTGVEGVAQWPYTHPGHLLPLLVGDWRRIDVFCSPAMVEHPLISAICEAKQRIPV
jgi:hypothetical protein